MKNTSVDKCAYCGELVNPNEGVYDGTLTYHTDCLKIIYNKMKNNSIEESKNDTR